MKTLYTFIFFLTLAFSLQAKVIIVNNNEGQPADNDNLQDAINKASSGDSIYLVGSPKSYGNIITINKQLTLIGPGYILGRNNNIENDTIQTQANLATAQIGSLTIQEDGDGTIITGIDFSNYALNNITINQGCQNVELVRNKINRINIYGPNTQVKQNFIIDYIQFYSGSSNAVIRNNIIWGFVFYYSLANGISGVEIINNTLSKGLSNVDNAQVDNNIFINDEPILKSFNNTFRHNVFTISEGDVFTEDLKDNIFENQGNEYSAARDKLFIATERTIDTHYQLGEDSPAKDVGLNDVDAGAFTDEPSSYKRSGLPAVPAIYTYTIHNGVGTAETGIKVTIKAKSHN